MQVNGDVRNATDRNVSIEMKASGPNGLVFLTSSGLTTESNVMALFVTEGRLDFRINVGESRVVVVSPDSILLCTWIRVELRLVGSVL